jgi:hypothetical protein
MVLVAVSVAGRAYSGLVGSGIAIMESPDEASIDVTRTSSGFRGRGNECLDVGSAVSAHGESSLRRCHRDVAVFPPEVVGPLSFERTNCPRPVEYEVVPLASARQPVTLGQDTELTILGVAP